jgi:hypothetical protein
MALFTGLPGLWLPFSYNGLVNFRTKVAMAFPTIDVQPKQHDDLVPNRVVIFPSSLIAGTFGLRKKPELGVFKVTSDDDVASTTCSPRTCKSASSIYGSAGLPASVPR